MGLAASTIVISAAYGVLVIEKPDTASALMLGYVALLLTIIVACNVWKKHD
jgi:glucose uptake protein GlcU